LPNIKVPVLLIQGEEDEYGTLNQVDSIKRGCIGPVRSLVLQDCGHDPHRDYPDSVIEAAVAFLNEVI
jgi:pimeloyl-ACP methyl ester carboxylesterase